MPFAVLGMSIQEFCRDQRKIARVIDQMKVLGNNLDELREEITALRNVYSEKRTRALCANDLKKRKTSITNMLEKVKEYIRKVTSVNSLRKGQPDNNSSKANQTDAKFQHRHIRNDPNVSMHAESIEEVRNRGSSFTKGGNIRHSRALFPQMDATLAPKYSEISCELDLQVENRICSPSAKEINIFPDSCIIQNYSENMGVCLSNGDGKETVTKSTQTNAEKLRQKGKYLNSHPKNPNCYFSKIKNAVITKKIVRDSSKNTCSVCENVSNTRRRHYFKREDCKPRTWKKSRNDFIDSSDKETSQENFCSIDRWSIYEDTKYRTFSFEDLPNLSRTSTSENFETNVPDNSNKIEEFPQRKKPRTYLIRKTTRNRHDNWLKHFEKSVVYAGQTSNLNLSSCSFSNENISCN